MDTAPPPNSNGIAEQAEETFTCSICSKYLITSMNVNCSRTYCLHCIGLWVKRGNGKPLCPECQAPSICASKSFAIRNFVYSITSKWTPEQQARCKQMMETRKSQYFQGLKKKTLFSLISQCACQEEIFELLQNLLLIKNIKFVNNCQI